MKIQLLYESTSMNSPKNIFLLIIACLLFLSHSQVLNSWASSVSTVTMHATFITNATQGYPITGSVTVSNDQQYTVYFYRPNQYYPNSAAFQFNQHKGSDNFSSSPVDTTGLWRVEVLPNNPNQNFLILVTIGSGQTIQRYVEVARRQKLLVSYLQTGENCNFTVQGISVDQAREYQITMYHGGSSLRFAREQVLFSNAGMMNTEYQVACTAPETGYYYIFISVSEYIMPLFPRVLINYQSDNYPCPAPSSYKDVNQLFPNCVQMVMNAAYPCIRYDYMANVCTQCQQSYILDSGSCYLSVQCGLDRYFHQGNCYAAPDNCQNFKQIGGDCTKCNDGYGLVNTAQGWICQINQYQTPIKPTVQTQSLSIPQQANNNSNRIAPNQTTPSSPISNTQSSQYNSPYTTYPPTPTFTPPTKNMTCGQGTYYSRGLCVLYPPHCSQFDQIQLICTSCTLSFTFDPSTLECILIQVNCPQFYTNLGNTCIPYPSNCNSTNAFGNCTSCFINYSLDSSGNCIAKSCPARQYLSNNKCLPVDANCNEYDQYLGTCLSCLNYYILASNGTCNPPQYNQLVSNGCRPRQYRAGNTCINVDPTCNLFDQYTGFCLSCIDKTQLLDKSNGKCYNIADICADRYYLNPITKTCQQVSPFCDTYDPATGYCLTCTYGLTLYRGGCVVLTPCGTNQYRNQDGICTDADPNCNGVDQATGACIGCQPGYDFNPGGICCYTQNYLLNPACKVFISVNCISVRPVFLNCQQCAGGYALLNGAFGKCLRKY